MLDYNELIKRIGWGEEFPFTFKNKAYWISQNTDGYYLTCVDDEFSQAFTTAEELVQKAKIQGQTLLQIWEDIKEQF